MENRASGNGHLSLAVVTMFAIGARPMKKKFSVVLSVIGLYMTNLAHTQGIIYLSNISQSFAGGDAVGSDSWYAQGFSTGTNVGGYSLNSIQLALNEASGSPSGFCASVYGDAEGRPGINISPLSGPDPTAGGIFNYTASDTILLPSTDYFIVLRADTPLSQGSYFLSLATTIYSSSDDWQGGGMAFGSADGLNWNRHGGVFQFAVYATAVPEPSSLGLLCLGFLLFGGLTRSRPRGFRCLEAP